VNGILSVNGGVRALFVPAGGQTTGEATPSETEYYTCEMHPDVHASAPGTCPKCGMALERVSKK
jgi:heavy metal-binding protein